MRSDGATIGEVFGEQLTRLEESEEPVLVTLTIGGNDLLSAYGSRPRLRDHIAADIAEAYEFLVDSIRRSYPNGTLVLATVYDPSDRTGKIPGVYDDSGPLPLEMLDRVQRSSSNAGARDSAVCWSRMLYARFLGHGVSAAETDRWYWSRSLIEPNARRGQRNSACLAGRARAGRSDLIGDAVAVLLRQDALAHG